MLCIVTGILYTTSSCIVHQFQSDHQLHLWTCMKMKPALQHLHEPSWIALNMDTCLHPSEIPTHVWWQTLKHFVGHIFKSGGCVGCQTFFPVLSKSPSGFSRPQVICCKRLAYFLPAPRLYFLGILSWGIRSSPGWAKRISVRHPVNGPVMSSPDLVDLGMLQREMVGDGGIVPRTSRFQVPHFQLTHLWNDAKG